MLATNGYDVLPPREAMPKAEEAAARALKLDDTLAEAHTSLAYVKLVDGWAFQDAEREFKLATELNPRYATAHQWYAWYLTAMGRLDEAVVETKRAQEHDPLSVVIYSHLGWTLHMARRYDEVIEQCRKALELGPNAWLARYSLGQAYLQKGMYPQAISEFKKGITALGGRLIILMGLDHAYALSGNRIEARKALDEWKKLSKGRHVPALYLAAVYEGLGERDQAFVWLEKAFEERCDYLVCLKMEPMTDYVGADPRFKDLMRRMGLPP